MFYRIRNHIFNLDRVIDIHIRGDVIVINLDNGTNINISLNGIDGSKLMDKIQLDLRILYERNYANF